MGTILLTGLSTITHFIIPFLLLVGIIIGLRKRSSSGRILELIGVLVFLCISIISIIYSIIYGPEIIDSPSKLEVGRFWDHTLILRFLSSVGILLFAIGFASDSLPEGHRSKETEQPHLQGTGDKTPPVL